MLNNRRNIVYEINIRNKTNFDGIGRNAFNELLCMASPFSNSTQHTPRKVNRHRLTLQNSLIITNIKQSSQEPSSQKTLPKFSANKFFGVLCLLAVYNSDLLPATGNKTASGPKCVLFQAPIPPKWTGFKQFGKRKLCLEGNTWVKCRHGQRRQDSYPDI